MIVSPIIPIWLMGIICVILIILKSKNWKTFIRQIIIVILLFLINLRIMIPSKNAKVVETNLNVFLVIDNTISMVAEDYNGNKTRLSGVKKDCEYIIEQLSGSSFSIITFNNTSKILTPMTKDNDMTLGALDTISPIDEFYARGTTMNVVLENLETSLKRGAEKEGRRNIVFFISDGEITNEEELKSFSSTKKYISNGAVLGYGTDKGGKMKVKDMYSDKEEYLEDTSADYPYPKAVSKIDEENLKKIAKDMDIDYIHATKQSNIESKVKEIKRDAIQNLGDTQKMLYDDIYFIFVIPLLGMLLFELINYRKNL